MSHNIFGHLFRVTTWGESHGTAIGCVVDGTPPGLPLSETDIQQFLDLRRPGQSRYVSQRQEPDTVEILSGVFDGQTTGTPINLMIANMDARSKDYGDIKERYRPGHADFTYEKKYGVRDWRGSGRASERETASRVAAGGIARKVLGGKIAIRGALIQMGPHEINRDRWDWAATRDNPFWCPDRDAAVVWEKFLDSVRKSGSSTGAVVEVVAGGKRYKKVNDGQSGYLTQSDFPLYFGLGEAKSVDRITVWWPSGKKQVLKGPGDINKLIEITEG